MEKYVININDFWEPSTIIEFDNSLNIANFYIGNKKVSSISNFKKFLYFQPLIKFINSAPNNKSQIKNFPFVVEDLNNLDEFFRNLENECIIKSIDMQLKQYGLESIK